MYPASAEFHEAVRNGNHQMPLLIFKDLVFTQSDIDVDTGIEFDDNFSLDEDISIGQTPANEIRFTLFNDLGLLNSYKFGEFVATLGVQLSETAAAHSSLAMLRTGYAWYYGESTYPFLRRVSTDGVTISAQPNFPVSSMLGYDGKVWAFADDGRYAVYNDKTGANITASNKLNTFMQNKVKGWFGRGYYYNKSSRRLMSYHDQKRDVYEFVPLGTFIAERPNTPDQIRVDMTCHDRMTLFDKDWPGFSKMGITFPTTIGTIFTKLCDYVGVPYRMPNKDGTFINSDKVISKEPTDKFSSVTMRTVLGWLAESAASNARFNRDGELTMAWINEGTGQSYNENDYYEFKPYWYETEKIDKLYNRATNQGKDNTVGTGKNGYLIQDNPFLPVS